MKYIKVGSSDLIPVVDVYAFIYESELGKTVLRIEVAEDVLSFDKIISLLKDTTETIEEYSETENPVITDDHTASETEIITELTNKYYNYCKDFKCNYNASKGTYFIEITKKSDAEVLAEQNESDTLDAYEALVDLYESI